MPKNTDWLPANRTGQLAMANVWQSALSAHAAAWSVPDTVISDLETLVTEAAAALERVQDKSSRTHVESVHCAAAFKSLIEHMRFIKNNYCNSPPRTDEDLASLELKPRDRTPTDTPVPANQATAKRRPLGDHLLELETEIIGVLAKEAKASDYGYRVYWGIMPAGGASIEDATGRKRELIRPPAGGDDLPFSRFTRRRRETFDFSEEDRGKTVYFCIRLENAKGQARPWGPVFNTIIP